MSEKSSSPLWFKIVAGLAVIWNAMGVMAYIDQAFRSPEALAALSTEEQAYFENLPAWVTAAFAFAVFGGTLGSILLLLKKGSAYLILIISLLGVLAQITYNLFIAEMTPTYGPEEIAMAIMIPGVAILLVWMAKSAKSKGWIS